MSAANGSESISDRSASHRDIGRLNDPGNTTAGTSLASLTAVILQAVDEHGTTLPRSGAVSSVVLLFFLSSFLWCWCAVRRLVRSGHARASPLPPDIPGRPRIRPLSFPPGPCLLLWTPDAVDGTSSAAACTTVAACGKRSPLSKKSPRIGPEFQAVLPPRPPLGARPGVRGDVHESRKPWGGPSEEDKSMDLFTAQLLTEFRADTSEDEVLEALRATEGMGIGYRRFTHARANLSQMWPTRPKPPPPPPPTPPQRETPSLCG